MATLRQAAPALAQTATGSVAGRVVNGSQSNQPVSSQPVLLYRLDGNDKQVVATATTGADGSFRFDGVQSDASFEYAASVSFSGVTYASALTSVEPEAIQQADITVYNTTSDSSLVSVTRMSVVLAAVDKKAGLLTFVESYHLELSGSATFVGAATTGQRQTLQFPLYPGARNLAPLDGFTLDDATPTADGFTLTTPVLPGDGVVSFTYDLPYQGKSLVLIRQLAYPTAVSEVILPTDVHIVSPQLTTPSSVQLGARSFATIQAATLAPHSAVELDLSGLPPRPQPFLDLDSLPIQLAIVALILAAIGTGVIYERRRPAAPLDPSADLLRSERGSLLRTIADLDDRAESGEIDGAALQRQRRVAIARLADLTERLRLSPGSPADAEEHSGRSQRSGEVL